MTMKQTNRAIGRMSRYGIDVWENKHLRRKRGSMRYDRNQYVRAVRRLSKAIVNDER